jgi:A/G-specific adenine glycosylase
MSEILPKGATDTTISPMFASLIKWSLSEFRHLPWRQHRTIYRTLVSEIMLQQTTVGTVLNHYERFLQTFPSLESLASASEEELLVAWKGLGYYRRAKNLKKIAEGLIEQHGGIFPDEVEALQAIPGIGPYTANALRAIGMDKKGLAIDANLERVLARLLGVNVAKGLKLHAAIAEAVAAHPAFQRGFSWRELNEALMDLGRTFCQARRASCELCPLRSHCVAFSQGTPLAYPALVAKPEKEKHELHLLRVFIRKGNKLLVYKKGSSEWLSGQYEVPTLILKTTDKKLTQYPVIAGQPAGLNVEYKTSITKYVIRNFIQVASLKELKQLGFHAPVEWREFDSKEANLSTATLKGLAKLAY